MSGKRCGLWKDNGYDIDSNMCMNPTPDARPSPWCFTDEGDKSCVENCRVPICGTYFSKCQGGQSCGLPD